MLGSPVGTGEVMRKSRLTESRIVAILKEGEQILLVCGIVPADETELAAVVSGARLVIVPDRPG